MDRYKVIHGSQSRHCCFEATVVDTERPLLIGGKQLDGQFETICECFNLADAIRIAGSMNHSLAEAKEGLAFLEKIEGHGYGGMADFEVARRSLRNVVQR